MKFSLVGVTRTGQITCCGSLGLYIEQFVINLNHIPFRGVKNQLAVTDKSHFELKCFCQAICKMMFHENKFFRHSVLNDKRPNPVSMMIILNTYFILIFA